MKKAALFVLFFFAAIGLTACRKDITEQGKTSEESAINDSSKADNPGKASLSKSIAFETDGYAESYCYHDGFLYYTIRRDSSGAVPDLDYSIHRYNLQTGSDETLFDAAFKFTEQQLPNNINSIHVTSEGDVVLYYLYQYTPEDGSMYYKQLDKRVYGIDGTEKSVITLEKDENITIMLSSYLDSEGNTYLSTNSETSHQTCLIKYDKDGKKTAVQKMSTPLDTICICNDRVILNKFGESRSELGYYDIETDSFDKAPFETINKDDMSGLMLSQYVCGTDVLLVGETDIYCYSCEKNELTSAVNLEKNYLNFDNIYYFAQTADNEYICVYSSENEDKQVMFFSSQADTDSEKETICIAGIGCNDNELIDALYGFNRSGTNDYLIDYRDYGADDKDSSTELMKDIMTGNIPDIYIINNMNYENLVSKNMLEDLNSYLENDDTLNKDYFIDSYLDAMSCDGRQYIITKDIVFDALAGNKSDIDKFTDGWTLDDTMKFYSTKPKGTFIFSDSSCMGIYNRLMACNMDNFIDWKTGKCSFDGDEYKQILEFCKNFNSPEYMDYLNGENIDNIKDGKLLFISDYIRSIDNIQFNDAIFDENAGYIGYPSGRDSGIYIKSDSGIFAMSSASEHKDIAWNVIKSLITGSYGKYKYDYDVGIPVSKTGFDSLVKYKTAKETYIDADGNNIEPVLSSNINGISLGQPTAEQFDIIKKLLSRATFRCSNNFANDMVLDDVKEFFDGSKSLDDTADTIQDKMTKYVNENL